MFDKVLVGIDEHQGGRDAIALAKVFAGEVAELTHLDRRTCATAGTRA